MTRSSPSTPKIIWIMWLQGLDEAPFVVKQCYASWKRLNPGWRVIFLDETNVGDYVDVDAILHAESQVQVQARSDIIRINLLATYGGVWADATCFCRKPLDTWLADWATSGFFAFSAPTRYRLIDCWFMASSLGCPLTLKLRDEANAYWRENRLKRYRRSLVSKALRLLDVSPRTTGLWFSYPIRKLLRAYPYMWLPYLFAALLRRDPQCRLLWQETAKFSAEVPHRLLRLGLLEPLGERAKAEIDRAEAPVYKLTWKLGSARYTPGSTLSYLFSRAAPRVRVVPLGPRPLGPRTAPAPIKGRVAPEGRARA